jgi:hypothetical protein
MDLQAYFTELFAYITSGVGNFVIIGLIAGAICPIMLWARSSRASRLR